jgi:hypothetical protein
VSEPPPPRDANDQDDLAFVLESIDFMMRLRGLSRESKRELAEMRSRVERFKPGQSWN